MSSGNAKRTRSERVSSLTLPPGTFKKAWNALRRSEVLLRVGLCVLAATAAWALTGGWNPPFTFRVGDIPARNVIARVTFQRINYARTLDEQKAKRQTLDAVYVNDPFYLDQLQKELNEKILQLRSASSYSDVDMALWSEFQTDREDRARSAMAEATDAVATLSAAMTGHAAMPPLLLGPGAPVTQQWQRHATFARFQQALQQDPELVAFSAAVRRSLSEFIESGLLEKRLHDSDDGNLSRIQVYSVGNPGVLKLYQVDDVRISQVDRRLEANLRKELQTVELAEQVYNWLRPRLQSTLSFDRALTKARADEVIRDMPDVMDLYEANEKVLARAGEPITPEVLALLREEHNEYVSQLGFKRLLLYSLAKLGMYLAVSFVCGLYIFHRRRRLLTDSEQLAKLLLLVFLTITLAWYAAPARIELIPLLLFSMTATLLYSQELAFLLAASVALLTQLTLGREMPDLVTVLACVSVPVLLLRRVRSRTKLMYVASWAAVATGVTVLGVGILMGRIPGLDLLRDALWMAGCTVAAGLLMTGLLPFIERFFGVQTDLSLLELGDVAHPLLQELVRRAPGTYNHSINVASIAEAAAESIGANGLLVRVGAYFHDIGKMLKPGYFIENQGGQGNCHESLLPTMSTLVIIAHVKDGADLARKHNLPDAIMDFIQQHHGTTLVEYFYRRASQQRESDPDGGHVDEGSYRYPGPKPQTREAAVLMLADAAESASRTLVDPGPSRIESLVRDIAMKRLLDGQFDECGLTLKELRTVQDSLIKSLTVVYHGRIKYPDQQSA